MQCCFLLSVIPLYLSNHLHFISNFPWLLTMVGLWLLYIERQQIIFNTTTYSLERILKRDLVKNVPYASNFFSLRFLGSKLVHCIGNNVLHKSWKFYPKYFKLDDLLKKKPFYGFYSCQMTEIFKWTSPYHIAHISHSAFFKLHITSVLYRNIIPAAWSIKICLWMCVSLKKFSKKETYRKLFWHYYHYFSFGVPFLLLWFLFFVLTKP